MGQPFSVSVYDRCKASLLFACDYFRRRKFAVFIDFTPTPDRKLNLHVTIYPGPTSLEFTLRRGDNAQNIISQLSQPHIRHACVKGCGTVIDIVCEVVEWAIHTGWFVEKSFLNTLIQNVSGTAKQRNTTLSVVMRRASDIETI